MRAVIRTIRRQNGQSVAADRALDAPRLRIGRGTDQDVLVNDMHVPLAYAEIVLGKGTELRVEARTADGVWVNGALRQQVAIDPGDQIEAGRFRLRVLRPEGGEDLLLSVEESMSAREQLAGQHAAFRTRLSQTWLAPRRWAWLLMALVLLGGLVAPVALRLQAQERDGQDTELVRAIGVTDASWSSGPMSGPHSYFAQDCARCHEELFSRVRDDACQQCHAQVGVHTTDPALSAVPAMSGLRCAECHREHSGSKALISDHRGQCQSCHLKPDRHFAAAKLPPSKIFAYDHPEFSPRLARYDAAKRTFSFEEPRQDSATVLRETTNLSFPHDLHLQPKGVAGPKGPRVLDCVDCHVPDRAGDTFEPVAMEPHCAECHRLDFDPDQPDAQVPHGKPAQVFEALRNYYSQRALAGDTRAATRPAAPQRRPGATRAHGAPPGVQRWADEEAMRGLRDLFERRTCGYCHSVVRTADPVLQWDVEPVAVEEHALASARFRHGPHRDAECSSCHAAGKSASSEDVLLPDIKRCRECHGTEQAGSQVPSSCVMCHDFHRIEVRGHKPAAAMAGGK